MPEQQAKSAKVLFVDDSKLMRRAAESALSEHYQVQLASDGAEALGVLDQNDDIQAVITDLSMPEMDGHELIAKIKGSDNTSRRELPVLVVTGTATEDVLKAVRDAGAAGVMTKPFKPEALVDRVQQILAQNPTNDQVASRSQQSMQSSDQAICIETSAEQLKRRLRQAIALHLRHDLPLSIMQLQVVNLDQIESDHSQRVASSVMRFAQNILGQTLREEDSVGQTGEKTFTMVLPMTSNSGADALSDRLQQAFRKKKVAIRGEAIELQVELAMCDPGLSDEQIECIAAGKDLPNIVTNLVRFELPPAVNFPPKADIPVASHAA